MIDNKTSLLVDSPLEVRSTPNKGRGVFATREIFPGELIERAPIVFVPKEQFLQIEKTIFYDYLYSWQKEHYAFALGCGSLYNHSFRPNALYVKSEELRLIDFIALYPIAPGEEITINYNGDPESQTPVWFDVN